MPAPPIHAPLAAVTADPPGSCLLGGPAQLSVSWIWENRQTVVVQLFSLSTLPAYLIHTCRLSMKTAPVCRFRMPTQIVGPRERNVEFRLECDFDDHVQLRADIPIDINRWFRDVLPPSGDPLTPAGSGGSDGADRIRPAAARSRSVVRAARAPETRSSSVPAPAVASASAPAIRRRLLEQVLDLFHAIPMPRWGAIQRARPRRVGANNYIHRIDNQSPKFVQVIVLNETDRLRHDIVLGPGESMDYAALDGGASMPVPIVDSDAAFADSHIRLRVGDDLFALYARNEQVRQAVGDEFDEDAPVLNGFAGPGPMALVIRPGATLTGRLVTFATGPQLAAVACADSGHALYGIDRRDGSLVQKACAARHWDNWRKLGKPAAGLQGPVATVSRAESHYAVYALGQDGQIYEKAWLADRWEEWTPHAAPREANLRGLAAVQWESHRYGIYAVGDRGELYQKCRGPERAHDWLPLDGPALVDLTGPIAAVGGSDSSHGLYALGADDQVWQKWHGIGGSAWVPLGGAAAPLQTLAAAAWNEGHYLIAGVAADGNLWCREYRLGWTAWKNLGHPAASTLAGPVTAVPLGPTAYAYYAEGADGLIYQLRQGSWQVLDGS